MPLPLELGIGSIKGHPCRTPASDCVLEVLEWPESYSTDSNYTQHEQAGWKDYIKHVTVTPRILDFVGLETGEADCRLSWWSTSTRR